MLSDNISRIRKSKGMSQEALADRVHVVRQTVSKWEKGLSVPDAAALADLAEALGVSVYDLLGGNAQPDPERDEVAEQLAMMNELISEDIRRKRKSFKIILGVILFVVLFPLVLTGLGSCMYTFVPGGTQATGVSTLTVEKDGQKYGYTVGFDGNHRVVWQSGDSWVVEVAEVIDSDDVDALLGQLTEELESMGATVGQAQ